jgi:hypothetical protein
MPPVPTYNKRVKGVRFDPELLRHIEADADRRGQSFSDWIRDAAIARLGHHGPPPPRETAAEVVQRQAQPFTPPVVPAGPFARAAKVVRDAFAERTMGMKPPHPADCGCLGCRLGAQP